MRRLTGMFALAVLVCGSFALFVDRDHIKAGDLFIKRDKGYAFVDDTPIPGNEQYFKAFEPAGGADTQSR